MSNCITKLPHSCGTSDGLQVFEREDGGVDGYCFSCRKYVRHPFGSPKNAEDLPPSEEKTDAQKMEELLEIGTYPTVDVPSQKLRAESLSYFGVKIALSEEDGKTPIMMCYPYCKDGKVVAYKLKVLENKRIWSVGSFKGSDPFGWPQAISQGAKKLIVTEGEDDTVAWHRIIAMHSKDEFKDLVAVISLPSGSSSAKKFFSEYGKKLKEYFQEVYLSFDMDEPGRKAVEDACMVFSGLKDIKLPAKDAKDCLKGGMSKAAFSALFKASSPKNSRLVFGEDIHERAKQPARFGELSWPWEHIQKDTRGIRYGETIYIGAG